MITEQFVKAWASTGAAEGGYVNDPADPGGATNHGITEAVARAHGFSGDMKDLPETTAREIAKAAYWDSLGLDGVAALSPEIAAEVFDTGFLSGIGTAGTMLQRALNLFNRSDLPKPLYPELIEDGHVGRMTVYALELYLAHHTSSALRPNPERESAARVLLRALNVQQGAYLIEITRARRQDEKFIFGWLLNRVA